MPDVRRLLTLLFSRCLLLKTCSAGTNRYRMCCRFFVLLDVIVLSAWRAYFAIMARVISQLFEVPLFVMVDEAGAKITGSDVAGDEAAICVKNAPLSFGSGHHSLLRTVNKWAMILVGQDRSLIRDFHSSRW